VPLTTPAVTLGSEFARMNPYGFPIAIAHSPIKRLLDRQIARVDLEHSEIVCFIDSDEARGVAGSIPHRDGDPRRPSDDVGVGDDRAVGANYESGAEAGGGTLTRAPTKELLEHIGGDSLNDFRLDGDHRRGYACYRVCDRGSPRSIDRRWRGLNFS